MVFSKTTDKSMLAITLLGLKRRFQWYIWFSDTFPFGWFQKDRQMHHFKKHDFKLVYLVEVIYFCFYVVVIFLWSRSIAQLPGCGDARALFLCVRQQQQQTSAKACTCPGAVSSFKKGAAAFSCSGSPSFPATPFNFIQCCQVATIFACHQY